MRYVIGAYPAAPTGPWDPLAHSQFLSQVARIPGFGGLELPYAGALHEDEAWLLDQLDPAWDLVLTAIPGTVARVGADPDFGLASPDARGREAALRFTAGLRDAVHRIAQHLGRASVLAVELHSAPTGRGDATAFAESLAQVAGWDWAGAALTVEHCDALRPDHAPQKGYLSLADELDAVAALPGIAGITVNWGRSVIEGRAAGTAIEHIERVRAAGALAGLMFSGVAAGPNPFGDPWHDAHLPPRPVAAGDTDLTGEPSSLLGPAEIADALRAAGGQQRFTGLKISVRPSDLPVAARVAYLRDAVALLERTHATG
jgi:Domain of unknown function (DUF4862)